MAATRVVLLAIGAFCWAACGDESHTRAGGVASAGGAGATGGPTDVGVCLPGAFIRNGQCVCPTDTPELCVSGCVNLAADPDNCGQCGMKCNATSTCNRGACGPEARLEVAADGCTALELASSGAAIFYADEGHGTIGKVGAAAPLVTGERGPTWLAANGASLFWYDKATKTLRAAAQTGGAARDVFTNTSATSEEIGGFVVTPDGASLYVSLGANVVRVSASGAPGTPLIVVRVQGADGGLPQALALNGALNLVFVTSVNRNVFAPLLSSSPAVCGMQDANMNDITTSCPLLAHMQGELLFDAIIVIGGSAVWADGATLKTKPILGDNFTFDVVAVANASITAMSPSPDAGTIFVAENGSIDAVPFAMSSTPVPIARGQLAATSLANDDARVYWATGDCTIMSAPRP